MLLLALPGVQEGVLSLFLEHLLIHLLLLRAHVVEPAFQFLELLDDELVFGVDERGLLQVRDGEFEILYAGIDSFCSGLGAEIERLHGLRLYLQRLVAGADGVLVRLVADVAGRKVLVKRQFERSEDGLLFLRAALLIHVDEVFVKQPLIFPVLIFVGDVAEDGQRLLVLLDGLVKLVLFEQLVASLFDEFRGEDLLLKNLLPD